MDQDAFTRWLAELLPAVSGYLRRDLGDLRQAAAALAPPEARDADPELDRRAAALDQAFYRLLRLATSLSGAAALLQDEPLPLRDVDLPSFVEELCGGCASLAELLGLEFSFRRAEGAHLCAVNPAGFEQMFFHLISNAFKFTPSGGSVTVELRFAAGRAFLSVTDTGTGVPEEERLFDRCLQPGAPPLPPHGLGLGLPLCRCLAQRQGGAVLAESKAGKGTRITVSLPDRRVGPDAVEDVRFDYAGGFNHTLLGLADALPAEAFYLRRQE